MSKQLLLGDEAIAQAALDAGLSGVSKSKSNYTSWSMSCA